MDAVSGGGSQGSQLPAKWRTSICSWEACLELVTHGRGSRPNCFVAAQCSLNVVISCARFNPMNESGPSRPSAFSSRSASCSQPPRNHGHTRKQNPGH